MEVYFVLTHLLRKRENNMNHLNNLRIYLNLVNANSYKTKFARREQLCLRIHYLI